MESWVKISSGTKQEDEYLNFYFYSNYIKRQSYPVLSPHLGKPQRSITKKKKKPGNLFVATKLEGGGVKALVLRTENFFFGGFPYS